MEFLITHRAVVDAHSGTDTALITAIRGDDNYAVELLLRNGADPNQPGFGKSTDPFTPIDQACALGNITSVRTLLRAGADVSQGYPLEKAFTTNKDPINVRRSSSRFS